MRPPLFFRLAERKVAAAAVEKKGVWAVNLTHLCQVDRKTGVVVVGAVQTCKPVPGALYPWGTEMVLSRIWGHGTAFGGGHRMAPAPLFAARCPSGVGNPGPACLRGVCRRHFLWASAKGRGHGPSPLCRFKGVRGEIEIPPGFSLGGMGGHFSFQKRNVPFFPRSPLLRGEKFFLISPLTNGEDVVLY